MTACDSSHCDRSYQEGNDNQPFSAAAMLIWVPASHCLDPVVPKDGHNAQGACEKCNGCFKADPGLRWLHAASPHLAAGRAQNDRQVAMRDLTCLQEGRESGFVDLSPP